jgi:TP901 family phage tail tape measure protein
LKRSRATSRRSRQQQNFYQKACQNKKFNKGKEMSKDLERIIKIVFRGDNETQLAFKQLKGSLDALEGGVRSVTGPLSDIADQALKAQVALATMATGGIALAVKEAGDFDYAFREISTLIDAAPEEIAELRKAFLDFGASEAIHSFEDLQGAMYQALSAGVEYTEVLDFMRDSQKLAAVTATDLESTVDLLTSVINAYGLEAGDAERVSDILFETVRQGKTTLEEMAGSLSGVTLIASELGVPIEDIGAALATMTAQGEPTARAVTKIRGVLESILNPAASAAQHTEALGYEFGAAALEGRTLDEILQDIERVVATTDAEFSDFFTTSQGLQAALALTGDAAVTLSENLEATRNATGTLDEQWDKMAGNIKDAAKGLVNSIRGALITAGLPILDEFGNAADALASVFDGLRIGMNEGSFDPVFETLNGVISRISSFMADVGNALPEAFRGVNWDTLLEGIEDLNRALGGVFDAFFQGLDPTDAEELGQIIQIIIDAAGRLATVSANIIEQWKPIIALLGDLTSEFGKMDRELAETTGSILGWSQKMETLWDQFGFFKGSLIALSVELGLTGQQIVRIFEVILGAGELTWGTLKSVMIEVGDKLAMVAIVANQLANALTLGQFEGLQNNIAYLEALRGQLSASADAAEDLAHRGMDRLRGKLRDTGTAAQDTVLDVGDLTGALHEIPGEVNSFVHVDVEAARAKLIELGHDAQGWDAEMVMEVTAIHDQIAFSRVEAAVQDVGKTIEEIDKEPEITIWVDDNGTTHIVQNKIAEIPEERGLDVVATLDEASVKDQLDFIGGVMSGYYDTIQTKVEWEAKLEIAELEANAQKVDAIMSGLEASVVTAGGVLESLFSNVGELREAGIWSYDIQRYIERQMDIQEKGLEIQEKMAEAEIAFMEIRKQRMESGEPLITVTGDGLQPHLEMIMFEVLGAVQARASEEYQNFLLGVE